MNECRISEKFTKLFTTQSIIVPQTPEKLKIVIEHDFQHKSEQYLKDLEFLKEHDITPKPKGLFGRFFTPLLETKDVLKDLVVIKNLKKRRSRAQSRTRK